MEARVTKEERLMVQVANLQKLLSDAEFASNLWRKSARTLYDAIRFNEVSQDNTLISEAKTRFEQTYKWETTL